jgi:hypothetical protein
VGTDGHGEDGGVWRLGMIPTCGARLPAARGREEVEQAGGGLHRKLGRLLVCGPAGGEEKEKEREMGHGRK